MDGNIKKFIVFEGLDFSGKSTIIDTLRNDKLYENYYFTREPGCVDLDICKKIRDIILKEKINPITEALLFASDRNEHINYLSDVLKNKNVICDRYLYSSLFYQSVIRKLNLDFIIKINNKAYNEMIPDIIFYIKVNKEDLEARIKNRENLNELDKEILLSNRDDNDNLYYSLIKKYKNQNTQLIVINTSDNDLNQIKEKINSILLK